MACGYALLMSDHQLSPAAAELFRQIEPRLMHPERFLPQLRRKDPESDILDRRIWQMYKALGIHVGEDSPLVRQTADLYRAGDFGGQISPV